MFQKVTLIDFKYSNNILLCFLNETKKGKRSIFSCLLKPRGYVFLLMYIENWFLHSQSVCLILTAHSALSGNILIKHYFSKSFCYKVFHEQPFIQESPLIWILKRNCAQFQLQVLFSSVNSTTTKIEYKKFPSGFSATSWVNVVVTVQKVYRVPERHFGEKSCTQGILLFCVTTVTLRLGVDVLFIFP